MGNLGGQEILVILLVGLIVLGPSKLPGAIRQVGRFAAEARRVAAGFKREFEEALEEPLAESKALLKAADPRAQMPTATQAGAATQTPTPTATQAGAATEPPAPVNPESPAPAARAPQSAGAPARSAAGPAPDQSEDDAPA